MNEDLAYWGIGDVDELSLPASFQLADGTLPFSFGDVCMSDSYLFSPNVSKYINSIVDKYCAEELEQAIESCIEVTESSFPYFYKLFDFCKRKICVNEDVTLVLSPLIKDLNGLCFEFNERLFIMVSMNSLMDLDEGETKFLLGHELGHIVIGHLNYHIVRGLLKSRNILSFPFGTLIEDKFDELYFGWCKDSEFTADRAGLICCGKIEYVESLFHYVNNNTNHKKSPVDDYSSHPSLNNRIGQLKSFQTVIKNNNL